jgi:hypothetical protein
MDLMRFRFAMLLSAAFVTALPLTAQTATPAPSGQTSAQHRATPRPKNLQVLPKDISVPDLMAMMRGYTKALGVECEFCHAEDPQTHHLDYASDAKPDKTIARTMIRMTQEINTKYLATVNDADATPAQKTVTCGTCHRGHSMPMPFNAAPGQMEHHSMPAKQ